MHVRRRGLLANGMGENYDLGWQPSRAAQAISGRQVGGMQKAFKGTPKRAAVGR